MESKLESLYHSMIVLINSVSRKPQRIKATTELYNYLVAKEKANTYFVKFYETEDTYFAGIQIVVDNTVDGYKLEF